MMAGDGICPKCGGALPPDAPQGFCPVCMYRLGFAEAVHPESESGEAPVPFHSHVRYFGDYELLEVIARGGMGVVYRARQVSLSRIVAVKMILFEDAAPANAIERFRREAQSAANLDHPNIVAIHEVGEHDGFHYFSMEYIQGQNLATLAGGAPMPAERAARYSKAIAEAIHHAHQRGILHRDLKPSNVLIDPYDNPKVTDFGLAKHSVGDSGLTLSGQVLGTPSFVPPEQCGRGAQPVGASPARGYRPGLAEGRDVGPWSDVYGLGAILYYLLTGRPPFLAQSLEATLAQVMGQEPAAPRVLNPAIPGDLETICLKCLEKEPGRRYETAQAVADELGRFLRQEPIQARRLGPVAKVGRWCRRQPVRAALVGALAAVIFSGAAGVIWQWQEAESARQTAERARKELVERLWVSHLAEARASLRSGRAGRRFATLEAIRRAAEIRPGPELRNEAIAALALPDARMLYPLKTNGTFSYSGLALDHRLERYAASEGASGILVRSMKDHSELLKLSGRGDVGYSSLIFSPGGRYLAQRTPKESSVPFSLWDMQDGRPILSVPFAVGSICFTAGERQAILAETEGDIHFYDLDSGTECDRVSVAPGVNHVAMDPAGTRLAISRQTSPCVLVLEMPSKSIYASLTNAAIVGFMAWSPDGTVLACPVADGRVFLWDVASGSLRTLEGHSGAVPAVLFNHLGDILVSQGWDGMTWFWDVKLALPLVSVPGGWLQNGFDPSDRRIGIGVSDREWGICEVEPGRECRRLGRTATLWAGQFAADNRVLATASSDGIDLWDVLANRRLAHFTGQEARSVVWHPDGTKLIASGAFGARLWPIELHDEPTCIRAGPARQLSSICREQAHLTADGRSLLLANTEDADLIVLDLNDPEHPKAINGHRAPISISLSRDGKWLATATWHQTGVMIWSTEDWKPVKELPVRGSAHCVFTPDGQWLLTGSADDYCLWEVGSWSSVFRLARDRAGDMYGSMAVSPDSRLAAVLRGRNAGLQLVSIPEGRELAFLETGEPLCFSPDGTLLTTAGEDHRTLLVWDLRLIRSELRALKLDWD